MNVYDFDKTIYDGDSTIDFYIWCLKKQPKTIASLPLNTLNLCLWKFKIIDTNTFKNRFYSFFKFVNQIDQEVENFWKENEKKIKSWYLDKKRSSDIIITASPEFIVSVMCNRIGVNCIGSKVDCRTGKLLSNNCKGQEKVKRFQELYELNEIEEFYSDSLTDKYLAIYAKKAFLVKKDTLEKWSFYEIH